MAHSKNKILPDTLQKAVRAFLGQVQKKYSDVYLESRLFGSFARKEGQEGSDVDLLILLKKVNYETKSDIYSLTGDILLKYDVMLSPLVMTDKEYQNLLKRERRIALEIEEQGISL